MKCLVFRSFKIPMAPNLFSSKSSPASLSEGGLGLGQPQSTGQACTRCQVWSPRTSNRTKLALKNRRLRQQSWCTTVEGTESESSGLCVHKGDNSYAKERCWDLGTTVTVHKVKGALFSRLRGPQNEVALEKPLCMVLSVSRSPTPS